MIKVAIITITSPTDGIWEGQGHFLEVLMRSVFPGKFFILFHKAAPYLILIQGSEARNRFKFEGTTPLGETISK